MELLLLVAVAAVIVWALLSAARARHANRQHSGCCQGHRQCPSRQPHEPEEP